jgi:peptidylprolyl isomerase
MPQAKDGDTVKVGYTGRLDDGTVFDSSENRDPLEFTIGDGNLIPGFEQAVRGMSPGESKTVRIPADEAYGPHHKEMTLVVDRGEFPPEMDPQVGEQLQVRQPSGQTMVVTVSEVSDAKVTLDANHPLAGKDLTFEIQLTEVVGALV